MLPRQAPAAHARASRTATPRLTSLRRAAPRAMLATMPAPRTAPLAHGSALALALAVVPALGITVVMTSVLLANHYGLAHTGPLYALALLANLAVWFGFSPAYLVGWVDFWDPGARARVGRLGVVVLAGALWFLNLFIYTLTATALGALLRA